MIFFNFCTIFKTTPLEVNSIAYFFYKIVRFQGVGQGVVTFPSFFPQRTLRVRGGVG